MTTKQNLRALMGLAAAALTTPVSAAMVYDYVGNAFNSIKKPEYGTHVTASVMFDDTVTPGFTGTVNFNSGHILEASIGTEAATINLNENVINYTLSFTFQSGAISQWYFDARLANAIKPTPDISTWLDFYINTRNAAGGGTNISDRIINLIQEANGNKTNQVLGSPGTWTLRSPAPVPLPASLPLLGAAVAGLGLLGARRARKATATLG